jgi:hypothetical protein
LKKKKSVYRVHLEYAKDRGSQCHHRHCGKHSIDSLNTQHYFVKTDEKIEVKKRKREKQWRSNRERESASESESERRHLDLDDSCSSPSKCQQPLQWNHNLSILFQIRYSCRVQFLLFEVNYSHGCWWRKDLIHSPYQTTKQNKTKQRILESNKITFSPVLILNTWYEFRKLSAPRYLLKSHRNFHNLIFQLQFQRKRVAS